MKGVIRDLSSVYL